QECSLSSPDITLTPRALPLVIRHHTHSKSAPSVQTPHSQQERSLSSPDTTLTATALPL
ncbi:hypothetical protein NDU88_000488, partial [Pleurodeles waltl]